MILITKTSCHFISHAENVDLNFEIRKNIYQVPNEHMYFHIIQITECLYGKNIFTIARIKTLIICYI